MAELKDAGKLAGNAIVPGLGDAAVAVGDTLSDIVGLFSPKKESMESIRARSIPAGRNWVSKYAGDKGVIPNDKAIKAAADKYGKGSGHVAQAFLEGAKQYRVITAYTWFMRSRGGTNTTWLADNGIKMTREDLLAYSTGPYADQYLAGDGKSLVEREESNAGFRTSVLRTVQAIQDTTIRARVEQSTLFPATFSLRPENVDVPLTDPAASSRPEPHIVEGGKTGSNPILPVLAAAAYFLI